MTDTSSPPLVRELTVSGKADRQVLTDWLQKRQQPDPAVQTHVAGMLAAVRKRGDDAVVEYTRQFDCATFSPEDLFVPASQIEAALALVPAEDISCIKEAAANIRFFHEQQRRTSWWTTREEETLLGQMIVPVDRAGLYVPGGQAGQTPLLSSLLMNAIPAQVAGVKEIVVTSPPGPDGTLNPYLLATAHLLGITRLYRAGSAWAVAALAYGTQQLPAVDIITGPGNIFVTTAKRLLAGTVGIDMIAGPSEIALLADHSADPAWLAADMLSQAEHDTLASAVLVTTEPACIKHVQAELIHQLAALPRQDTAKQSLQDWGAIVLCPDTEEALATINALASEHLELAVADPWAVLPAIRHAGAVFMGHMTPEPLGDYFAGPNHVLPTMGTARFSSALSVETFYKKISVLAASARYAARHSPTVARLARLEGLEAHARSMECRMAQSVEGRMKYQ